MWTGRKVEKCFLIIIVSIAMYIVISSNNGSIIPEDCVEANQQISLLIQETMFSDGLDRMIKKLYVDEGIVVNVQRIPDNQIETVIRLCVNSGKIPDLIAYHVPEIYGLIPTEMLVDLSEESWVLDLKGSKDNEIKSNYAYVFQHNTGLGSIIYNKDIFYTLQLEIPSTIVEFYEVCDQLIAQGIVPIAMCGNKKFYNNWINYTAPLFNREHAFDGLGDSVESFYSLIDQGYISKRSLELSYVDMIQRFIDDENAMLIGNFNTITDIWDMNYTKDVGVFAIPIFEEEEKNKCIVDISSEGFVIPKGSNQVALAKKVLGLWATPNYLSMYFMDLGGFPAFDSVDSTGKMQEKLMILYQSETIAEGVHSLSSSQAQYYDLIVSDLWTYSLELINKDMNPDDVVVEFEKNLLEYNSNMEKRVQ